MGPRRAFCPISAQPVLVPTAMRRNRRMEASQRWIGKPPRGALVLDYNYGCCLFDAFVFVLCIANLVKSLHRYSPPVPLKSGVGIILLAGQLHGEAQCLGDSVAIADFWPFQAWRVIAHHLQSLAISFAFCSPYRELNSVCFLFQFVADGIFKAELNEFLTRELAEDGYSGVEVRVTPTRTEIIILATRTQNVLGEKGRRIRELTAVVQKRFGFPEGNVELYAEKVATRGLCAIAQAESLRYKLLGGLAVRRACYGVLRFIMESGAKGCEVVVSGKLRGQRAKSMKFVDGLMIHSGDPVNYYVDTAVRHVLLRQGVLGIKVKIMLPWDPSGKIGPKKPLPDHVSIVEPKEEILPTTPISEQKGGKPEQPAMPQPVPTA
ncbi:40S ribosomal protein S3 [Egretta garzetta]|nr:40S ribosomal protein S3 [Egretta garzetta]